MRKYLVALTFAALATSPGLVPAADSPSADALAGAWILVGTAGKVAPTPPAGGRLWFVGGDNWTVTEADPKTGKVLYHHGGKFTLRGDEYVETINYTNPSTAALLQKRFTFKLNLTGDTLTKVGVGNQWNEVWKRLK